MSARAVIRKERPSVRMASRAARNLEILASLPPAVYGLAQQHGYDPFALLAWAVRDGRAVIVGPDGRKFREE